MWRRPMCGIPTLVRKVDHTDNTVALAHPDDDGDVAWWPVDFCDPVQGVAHSIEDFDVAAHQKQVLSLLSELADGRSTVAELRKTVTNLTQLTTSLESQVVALRAELQKVGKQTQNGSRFALLELD